MAILNTTDLPKSYQFIDTRLFAGAIVYIQDSDKNPYEYRNLILKQEYGDHHTFYIESPFKLSEKQSYSEQISEIVELVGKTIKISFLQGEDNKYVYDFIGIITHAELAGTDGNDGCILIQGKSKTILLDSMKRFSVYSDLTLTQLMQMVLSNYPELTSYSYEINIDADPLLEIVIQYNETDWEFIKRVCYNYGANIYYSGEKIIIGEKKDEEDTDILYGAEISRLNFSTRLLDDQFKLMGYDPSYDLEYDHETLTTDSFKNIYLDKTIEKNKLFNTEEKAQQPFPMPCRGIDQARYMFEAKRSQLAGKSCFVNGVSTTIAMTVGKPVVISLPKGGGVDRFIITKCIHRIDSKQVYSNEFEGVTASLKTIPVQAPEEVIARSVRAEVISTEDPKGQGRVQVKFPLLCGESFAWLRVLTLDAGLTEDQQPNRGVVMIPEVGTQVIVDFEMGNPNYPYVSGALFHGKNGAGGQQENHIKSFRTRTGLTLEFNDGKEEWGIRMYDKENNLLRIHSAEGKIEISANEEIVINSKSITLNATEQLKLVGSQLSEHSKEHEILVEGTFIAEANEQKFKSNAYKQTSTGGIEIISGSNVDIKGSGINMDMGGGAESPKAPVEARNLVEFTPVPLSLLESEIMDEESHTEEEGIDPKILSVKIFDKDNQETKCLSESTKVEVETKDMAGRTIKLALHDKETNDEVYFGDYFIPTNNYTVRAAIRKRERHVTQ